MNLNANPTPEQLRQLIAGHDHRAGVHVLWVKRSGDVAISLLRRGESPTPWRQAQPDLQICYEAFLPGNGYVGPEAAADDEWIAKLFDGLAREWRRVKGTPEVACVALD